MLEAAASALRFCCPGCGGGLAAPRADGGRALACHRCGEQVRVPTRPHPWESDVAPDPLVSRPAAVAAAHGLKLLGASVRLALVEHVILLAALGYWLSQVGPVGVIDRQFADLGPFLLAAWLVDLTLLTARTWLRWVGYRHCRPAAVAVMADDGIVAARTAAVARWVGWVVVPTPWLLGWPSGALPPLMQAAVAVGFLAWLGGTAAEFGTLVVWQRLLIETAGNGAADRVTRYVLALVGTAVAVPTGLSLLGMSLGLPARRAAFPARPGPTVRLEDLSPETWYAVGGFLAGLAVIGLVLAVRYHRLLSAVRGALAGR